MKYRNKISLPIIFAALMSTRTEAAYVFTLAEVSGGVLLTGSGSVLLRGVSPYLTSVGGSSAGVIPLDATITVGGPELQDLYRVTFSSREPFGPGASPASLPIMTTGPEVGISPGEPPFSSDVIDVPAGYVSGDPLAPSSALYAGETFASLGLTPGVYAYNYVTPSSEDSFTVQIISSQVGTVPLPNAAPMFGVAILALGAVGKGLKRMRSATA